MLQYLHIEISVDIFDDVKLLYSFISMAGMCTHLAGFLLFPRSMHRGNVARVLNRNVAAILVFRPTLRYEVKRTVQNLYIILMMRLVFSYWSYGCSHYYSIYVYIIIYKFLMTNVLTDIYNVKCISFSTTLFNICIYNIHYFHLYTLYPFYT